METWSKELTKVRVLPCNRNQEMGALAPLMFTFQRDGSLVLEKGIPGHNVDTNPISSSEGFIYISEKAFIIIIKVNAQRKTGEGNLLISMGELRLLICVPLQRS